MSVTANLPTQAVLEWTKIFPRQVTENYTSSVTFMKQLTVLAVSSITYLKNVFPEDCYNVESFGGLKLRILKMDSRDELAKFVSLALTQAFEAFEKKYLQQLVLCFYDTECNADNLIEYHIFEYEYNSEGMSMNVHSKGQDNAKRSRKYSFENVKDKTLQMIRACVLIMQTCSEMPESYDVSLRLYYNEDAPEGYQAPGFTASEESADHLEGTLAEAMWMGRVQTPFHSMSLRTYMRQGTDSSQEANASLNPPILTQHEQGDFEDAAREGCGDSYACLVRCPCNKTDYDPAPLAMLTCQGCQKQQHAACFGLRRARPLAPHRCDECSDARGDPPHAYADPRLAPLAAQQRECLSVFRRALWWARGRSCLNAPQLCTRLSLPPLTACKLVGLLQEHGVVRLGPRQDLLAECEVDETRLREALDKFFQCDEEELVERLVEESLSQHSQQDADLIGYTSADLQKVSLNGPAEQTEDAENDELMQQYRAAVGDVAPAGPATEELLLPTKRSRLSTHAGHSKRARVAKNC